jgi:hypothetical protein
MEMGISPTGSLGTTFMKLLVQGLRIIFQQQKQQTDEDIVFGAIKPKG